MRPFICAALLTAFLAAPSTPAAAQTTQQVFLFVLESKGVPTGTIHVFSVNTSSGALAEVPGSPFTAGLNPQQLVIDPTDRFLYVLNEQSQDITAFSINPATGALTELPGSPVSIGADPVTMGVDPTGRFLYAFANAIVNGSEEELTYEYAIDSVEGILTPSASPPTALGSGLGASITSIAFDSAGNLAYLGQAIGGSMQQAPTLIYNIDFTTGNLTLLSAVQPASGGANQLATSLNGGFLFSVNKTAGALDPFSILPGLGLPTELPGSPYLVGPFPDSADVSPSGNFVYVANQNGAYQPNNAPSQYDGSISGFSINSGTGTLAQVPGSPYSDGINPAAIVVDPSGNFVYTVSTTYTFGFTGFTQVLGFFINPSSGALTPFSNPAWTDTAQSVASGLVISNAPSGVTNPAPIISSLSPASTIATDTEFTLQVNGASFVPNSTVYFGGQPRATTFVSASQLSADIPANQVADSGTAIVFVFNPLPGGGASTSVEFPVASPAPSLSALSPESIAAGSGLFSLTAVGTGFVASSVISFNGVAMPTSFQSTTQVVTQIPGGDITSQGSATVFVTNPSNGVPGGGTSNTLTFAITPQNEPLAITGISPASATAGGPAFTLTVSGTGFVAGDQITFNLNNVPTTYVSSTQLTAAIPATAIAIAGNPYVIVSNASGFNSNQINFAVSNPQPGGGSVSPPSSPAGSNALTLTVSGTGFVQGSTVWVNGTSRVTQFVNSTTLQATLLSGDLARGGTLVITVMNPPPGGGTSAALNFTVADYVVTVPGSSAPVPAGQTADFTLMVSPSGGAFSNPVTFSLSPLPAGAAASFTPSSTITPGAAAQTLALAITTTSRTTSFAVPLRRPWPPRAVEFGLLFIALAFSGASFFVVAGRARRLAPRIALILLMGILAGVMACGAVGTATSPPSNPDGTPAGTYPITVTATSGGDTHTTTVTLTVM